jgi:hypothetical protein
VRERNVYVLGFAPFPRAAGASKPYSLRTSATAPSCVIWPQITHSCNSRSPRHHPVLDRAAHIDLAETPAVALQCSVRLSIVHFFSLRAGTGKRVSSAPEPSVSHTSMSGT